MSLNIVTGSLDIEIFDEIGQSGKHSQVFRAHDKQLNAIVAVKKILKSKIKSDEYFEEAKKLYASAHQNVIDIKYACSTSDHVVIAMPFFKNGSLKTLIDSRYLTIREIIKYSTQFLSGLSNIHSKKLIHFDIKADNILISDNGEAVVSDFGITKFMDANGIAENGYVYPKHVAPEMFNTTSHTMQYDIYCAGLTIYRMCNGNPHFYNQITKFSNEEKRFDAVQNGTFPDRKAYLPHIPKSLQRVINRSLSVLPSQRYPTVIDMINDLSLIEENLDWQCGDVPDGYVYTLEDEKRIFKLVAKNNTNGYSIDMEKIMKSSNKPTKIGEFCRGNLSKRDFESLISRGLESQNEI